MSVDGVILGFDFGLKRIGVAIGNTMMREATPLTIVDSRTKDARWKGIEALVKEWSPVAFVVGIPRHPDGTPHEMTERCERFTRQLDGRYHLPIFRVDERYSSAVVEQNGQNDPIDHEAACVILQQYFFEN